MSIFETLNDTRGAKKDERTRTPGALCRGTLYPMHVASLLSLDREFSLIRFRESARIASRLVQHEGKKEERKEGRKEGTALALYDAARHGTARHGTHDTVPRGKRRALWKKGSNLG